MKFIAIYWTACVRERGKILPDLLGHPIQITIQCMGRIHNKRNLGFQEWQGGYSKGKEVQFDQNTPPNPLHPTVTCCLR